MGKPKRGEKTATKARAATANAVDQGGWNAPDLDGEVPDTALDWEDRQLLSTVSRFLFTVVEPRFLRRAVRAAYSKVEHDELWRLFDRAAGREKSLDVLAVDLTTDPERKRALLEVDEFENTWFPRVDRLIRRYVPEAEVERFRATFFKDLSQQPLGPDVLDSTSTLLTRIDALAKSKLPGARELLAKIRERGLTVVRATEIRERIASLRAGLVKPRPVNHAAAAAATEAQRDALKRLRLAWNDWSTTLRPLYDVRDQIQLGLTEARRAAATPDGAPPSPGEPAPLASPTTGD